MPCCISTKDKDYNYESSSIPSIIRNKVGKYDNWAWFLYRMISRKVENVNMERDDKCFSPRNIVITGVRK